MIPCKRNFNYNINDSIVLNTELLLTGNFFAIQESLPGRNQLDAHELDWFIPRKN
jgi:hypothetical protein